MSGNRLSLILQEGTPPTIRATGELNCYNYPELRKLIHKAFDNNPAVNLQLDGLDFVDSSGLKALILAEYEARSSNRSLLVTSVSSQLRRLLDISELRHFFRTATTQPVEETSFSPSNQSEECSLQLRPSINACREIRDWIANFATIAGYSATEIDDIKLAVGEAVTNAIKHGNCGDDLLAIECRAEAEQLSVKLKYSSEPFDPATVPSPDLVNMQQGGMGIYIMRLVMDEIFYEFDNGRATVTLIKRLTKQKR